MLSLETPPFSSIELPGFKWWISTQHNFCSESSELWDFSIFELEDLKNPWFQKCLFVYHFFKMLVCWLVCMTVCLFVDKFLQKFEAKQTSQTVVWHFFKPSSFKKTDKLLLTMGSGSVPRSVQGGKTWRQKRIWRDSPRALPRGGLNRRQLKNKKKNELFEMSNWKKKKKHHFGNWFLYIFVQMVF